MFEPLEQMKLYVLNFGQDFTVFENIYTNYFFSGYEDKFTGVCGMLLKDHDSYHGSLKTTGKMTNCVLSFNVQGIVLYDMNHIQVDMQCTQEVQKVLV